MEKYIALLNPKSEAVVKEIDDPNIDFEQLAKQIGATYNPEISVLTPEGNMQKADLSDKLADYFQTRTIEIEGMPRKYKCLELELRQKTDFWQYCKNTSCIIADRQVYDISSSMKGCLGKLTLFGQTFYIKEKDPSIKIEFDETTLDKLMQADYFNYRGNMYELQEGRGEIELKGRNYTITPTKQEALTPASNIFNPQSKRKPKETETTYKETREIIIRRTY